VRACDVLTAHRAELEAQEADLCTGRNTWQLNDFDVQSQALLKKKSTSAIVLRLVTLMSEIQNR
jgi:hypothetical protein